MNSKELSIFSYWYRVE